MKIMAQAAPESPIDDFFGALEGDEDEKTLDIPVYIRKLLTMANDHFNNPQGGFVYIPIAPESQCTMSEDDQRGTQR